MLKAANLPWSGDLSGPVAPPFGSTNYHRVRDAIRADIMSGAFGSGAHLKMSTLVQRYSLSAAPIREALNQLEAEGILELLPNRGAQVRPINREFVAELFEIRLAIEPMLVEKGVAAATRADMDAIEAIQIELETAITRRDTEQIIAANRRFHRAFYAIRPNRSAIRLLNQHSAVTSAVRRHYGFPETRFDTIVAEHRELIAAGRAANPAKARELLYRHIEHSIGELLPRVPE